METGITNETNKTVIKKAVVMSDEKACLNNVVIPQMKSSSSLTDFFSEKVNHVYQNC